MLANQKVANRWVAQIIPLILIAVVGYASFIVTGPLCVDYLLRPPSSSLPARPGVGTVILVLYFTLLFFVATTFFRILYTVIYNPGFVERGPQFYANRRANLSAKPSRSRSQSTKWRVRGVQSSDKDGGDLENGVGGIIGGRPSPDAKSPGLESFFQKDVFVCEGDGRPIWCSMCMNWKPDRTHHCREVERCVRKMDHFCPWVGGIISEKNYKFFIQFNSWTALFCIFNIMIFAIFIQEVQGKSQQVNTHWIVAIALACFFCFLSLGMSLSSLQFVLLNTTTVENLSRKTKRWSLAVYVPPSATIPPHTITITYPLTPSHQGPVGPPPRTFVVLHTKPGENPFHLGRYGNFKSVMGDNLFDWLVPLRYSPCCDHESGESEFTLGPVVQRLREEAGIAAPHSSEDGSKSRRGRQSRRHSSSGRRGERFLQQELTEGSPEESPSSEPAAAVPAKIIPDEPPLSNSSTSSEARVMR